MGTFRRDLHIPNGTLYIYDYTTPPSSPTTSSSSKLQSITLSNFDSAESFHPLGVEYDEKTSTLYVVNHAFSGACIEIFSLDLATAAATHRQTIKHPLLHAPNSIHSLGEGKLYVTNDHHFHASVYPILSKIETFSGAPGGTVMYVDTRDVNNTVKIVARVPFANGIVMLNSSTLAVSSTSKPGVYFFDVSASDYSLHLRNVVSAPASVDNLNVDSNGALLLAGHPDPFRITQLSKKRWACVRGSQDEKEREACGCEAPSWVGEWTQEQGLTTLSLTEGFCSSTTFARDVGRGVGIVSGLYADGLLEVRS
ncbi:unnamed protein product [Periconia digitata]|uniref:Arylesterase n=1 Tax=Periconia digitata TaxID=1303443 RepID=A0A9W4UJ36_9PLEO|nr:unnamed protein product [Periconia digitata]